MAPRPRRFHSVVAVVLVLVLGFTALAVFPEQGWIEAVMWLSALGIAIAATIRRWVETDEEDITPDA